MPGCRGSGGGVSVLVKQSRLMSSSRKYMNPVTSVNQDYLQSVIQFGLDRTEICNMQNLKQSLRGVKE